MGGMGRGGGVVSSMSRAVRTLLMPPEKIVGSFSFRCDTRARLADVGWSFAAAASATAFLSVAAAGEVAGAVESMGLVSLLAAAEADASDAMDCGLILDGVLDPSRLNIGV